jgi:hypothetical protein
MAILWLPQRLARNVGSPRVRGWLILAVAFVLGIRALVVLLGGA